MVVYSNVKNVVFKLFQTYTEASTAHGVKYIGHKSFSIKERLFWVSMVLVHASLAVTVGYGYLWMKFTNSPIETIVEDTHYPLSNLVFPSVTLCPANKINRTVGTEILHRYLDEAGIDRSKVDLEHILNALFLMEYPTYFNMLDHLELGMRYFHIFKDLNISDFMLKTLPDCEELFEDCFWQGEQVNCSEIFSLQRTEEGYCYAFNSFTNRQHCRCRLSTEFDPTYAENTSCNYYHVSSSGSYSGLTVLLKKGKTNEDPNGVLVIINSACEHPLSRTGRLLDSSGSNTLEIEVTPAISEAHESLEKLALKDRNCVFPSDRKLNFYYYYSENNCFLECRHEYILKTCKCQPPHFYDPDIGYPACGLAQLMCIAQLSSEGKIRNRRAPNDTNGKPDCDCWPSCKRMQFNVKFRRNVLTLFNGKKSNGILDVYYSKLGALKYQKRLAFTVEQLLASIGGTGSLFIGASMISGAELVYYSIRGGIQLVVILVKYYHERNTPPNVHFLR